MPDGAPASQERSPRARRSNTTGFVVVFVVSVLIFLTGYRYLVDTPLNDWYLFRVAQHTSMVLNLVGDDSRLEDTSHYNTERTRQVRAELQAWLRGDDSPTPEQVEATSDATLSPWERYEHRLIQQRRNGSTNMTGPRVSFTWRAGLTSDLYAAENALKALDGDSGLAAEDLIVERRRLRDQRDELRTELRAANASEDPSERRRARGDVFHFKVISECGAIEVMAIFLAAVLAFPTLWRKRLIGIAVGIPIMYGVNIFRLCCLAVIGALDHGGKWFEFAHMYVWQSVYIIFVVAVWLAWIEFVVRRKSK